jgi:hypothetical protein
MLLRDSFVVFLSYHLLLSMVVSIEQRTHLCHCLNLLYQLSTSLALGAFADGKNYGLKQRASKLTCVIKTFFSAAEVLSVPSSSSSGRFQVLRQE